MKEKTPNLNAALAKFQKAMGPIPKNRTANIPTKNGGSYSYKYADFSDLIEASKGHLAEFGLAIEQGGQLIETKWCYVTTLLHDSGEERSHVYPMRQPSDDPKADGSWFTYYRRYGASAALGLSTDEDDDGTGATKGKKKGDGAAATKPATGSKPDTAGNASKPAGKPAGAAAPPAGQAATAVVSEAQIKRLFAIMAQSGWKEDQVKTVLHTRNISSFKEITKGVYDRLIELIQAQDFDNWYAKHSPE